MTLGFVDHIYVVNLPDRTDRRREIRRQFTRVGWDPDDPQITYFDAVKPVDQGAFPSVGARGCFMSHLGVLTAAGDAGFASVAIFEDDLDFADDFAQRVDAVSTALADRDWRIFYGGYHLETSLSRDDIVTAVTPDTVLRTTHFVCFRSDAIARARDYLTAMLSRPAGDAAGGPMHVDGAYHWFRRAHPSLNCYAATPPLGHQRPSKSDIASGRWFDRAPALSHAVAALRRIKRIMR